MVSAEAAFLSRSGDAVEANLSLPLWVPLCGSLACGLLMGVQAFQAVS